MAAYPCSFQVLRRALSVVKHSTEGRKVSLYYSYVDM